MTPIFKSKYLNFFKRDSGYLFASRSQDPTIPKEGPDAVFIVPVWKDARGVRRIIVTLEWREAIQKSELAFPAGLREADEPYGVTARRELKEETGLDLTHFHDESPITCSSAGMTDETGITALCEAAGEISLNPGIDNEKIKVLALSRKELQSILESYKVRDITQDRPDHFAGHSETVVEIMRTQPPISGRAWPILYTLAAIGRFGHLEID